MPSLADGFPRETAGVAPTTLVAFVMALLEYDEETGCGLWQGGKHIESVRCMTAARKARVPGRTYCGFETLACAY